MRKIKKNQNNFAKPFTLWLVYLLVLTPAVWASSEPPPFVLDTRHEYARITIYSEYLLDPQAQLTLNDVRTHMSDQFIPAKHPHERIGFHSGHVWLRVAIRNNSNEKLTRTLELMPGLLRELQFYTPSPSGYSVKTSGLNYSPSWADIKHRHQLFILQIPAQQTHVYYMRMKPNLGLNFSLHLSDQTTQLQRNLQDATPFWILTGFLICMLIYNFSMFFHNRMPVFLYYGLFQSFYLVAYLTSAGFLSAVYFPVQGVHARLETVCELLALSAGLLFSLELLQLRKHDKKSAKLILYLAYFSAGLALISLSMPTTSAGIIAYGLTMLASIFYISISLYWVHKNIPLSPIHLIGRLPLLITVLLASAASFNVISLDISLPLILAAGATIEGAIFIIGVVIFREKHIVSTLGSLRQSSIEALTNEERNKTLKQISHDIRTPMSGILGMAELLDDTPLTPNQKECVKTIRSSGEKLLGILDGSAQYSDENNFSTFETDKFDPHEIIIESLDLFRERAEEQGVELIANIRTNVPSQVHGNPVKVKQILTQIVASCIRNCESGEIILDVGPAPSDAATIRFELEGSAIPNTGSFLSVLDGIESENPSDEVSLGIVRDLISSMNGQSGLQPGRRYGDILWITLPLPSAETEDDLLTSNINPSILKGRQLLVVDDSSTVTRVIRQQALSWGMSVTLCHDPKEALATIRTQANLNEPFDAVILDQQMPSMTGIQLAIRIQEDRLVHTPMSLIMLTGVADAPSDIEARNAGIHKVLHKPVSGIRLKHVLMECLDHQTVMPSDPLDIKLDSNLKILAAEDHVLSQKVIRSILDKLGLQVDVVPDGKQAVESFKRRPYDIVLMDCEMPVQDGFSATKEIRLWEKETQRKPTPIIALTAHILREHKDRSMECGMNAHVAKPIDILELTQVIARYTQAKSI